MVPDMRIKIVNWTAMVDDRCIPDTIGFFVELAGEDSMYDFPRIHSLAHNIRFS